MKSVKLLFSFAILVFVMSFGSIYADNGFINQEQCEDCGEVYSKDYGEPHECPEK